MKLGILGRINSGKSTLANILVKNHNFIEYTFSDPIKDMLCVLLRLTREEFEATKRSNAEVLDIKELTIRKLLQTLGTEWGRNLISSNIWVNSLKLKILNNKSKNIVVSDVRFENEYDMLDSLGFTFIRIKSKFEDKTSNHESDVELSNSRTYTTIYNYNSIADLEKQVEAILRQVI